MIDFEKIGNRIKEQRKQIAKISQERMAEDLFMYQADISNLEKAKAGSGISDLSKLDLIADYFNVSLQTLIFGNENNMPVYDKDKIKIKKVKKKIPNEHKKVLSKLMNRENIKEDDTVMFECGSYVIYSVAEYISTFNADFKFAMPKLHTFIFLDLDVIAVAVIDVTTLMNHIFEPHFKQLKCMIQFDVLDVLDVWRTVNPYWVLGVLTPDEEKREYYAQKMYERMDVLKRNFAQRNVLYIESVYVQEDCRKHGIFKMYIDMLKILFPESIMWLNMEPTSSCEVKKGYKYVPIYTASEIEQLSLNAYIAEKVGFTVDSDTWHRTVERIEDSGEKKSAIELVRKCAFFIPLDIKEVLKEDGDLVQKGRALQKVVDNGEVSTEFKDVSLVTIDDKQAMEYIESGACKPTIAITIMLELEADTDMSIFVSNGSLANDMNARLLAEYSTIEEALKSEYSETIERAFEIYFCGFNDNDIELDDPYENI